MKPLAWGDELCGQVVAPESWAGGVIQHPYGNRWEINAEAYPPDELQHHGHVPIFPPRGWAGKTDAELWEAVVGCKFMRMYDNPDCPDDPGHNVQLHTSFNGLFHISSLTWPAGEHLELLIRCAQNAAVLQARLRSTT